MPPAEMPTQARRQSSVERGEPTRRPRASLTSDVGLGQGVGLKRGRDGSARTKDLGPSWVRAP